ncbi:hypothetical protein FIV04_24760 (plasmid) [Vibrio sp. THAF190c]|nr:hypothetical protein FIV04_24760 [Vibrio sp. THAF190c]
MFQIKRLPLTLLMLIGAPLVLADNQPNQGTEAVQDMSDPLAVYTQVGMGYTDKGLNLKLGQTFDTGSDTTMGMHVLELKGGYGDALGMRDYADDSIDSLRLRRFGVDLTNGRGSQVDFNYDFDTEAGSLSYSFIQAIPAIGPLQLYPLAGVGAAFANNALGDNGEVVSGYSVPGTFAVVGTYGKLTLTDNIWLNYNPMYMTTLSGSDIYKDHAFANSDSVLTHEFAASYQINPKLNVRYFAQWNEEISYRDGSHIIEFNYQL